ncbi:MAG: hypothetical protein COA78_37225, partial [Blastopirellula sp.]
GVPSTMLNENQSALDSILGSANYDIGHVFGTTGSGGSGLASLGVVGNSSFKGKGASVSSDPSGPGWLILAGGEIGHQFGAPHSFNASAFESCVGTREASEAYEPASGTTIMSYAGICGADDLEDDPSSFFHAASYESIQTYIATGNGTPHSKTSQTNNIPTINAGSNYTIPANTPFELDAVGADADAGDTLTYSWEQLDLGPAQSLPISDNGSGPLFRSFEPVTESSRNIPRLEDLLNNVNTAAIGEALPSTNRSLNFRVTVRDGEGGVNSDDVLLTVVDTGAAFAVISPNTAVASTGASSQTIEWNVAGTTANGINTANVDILLSIDGGQTFPITLATTANDGNQSVTLPNITTTQARIKVQGSGNIFYDISDVDFSITADPGVTITETGDATEVSETGSTDTFAVSLNSQPSSNVVITIQSSDTNEATVDTSTLTFTPANWNTAQTVTITGVDDAYADGSQNSFITLSINAALSDNAYDAVADRILGIVTLDDEENPLVGVDFDPAGNSPPNWNTITTAGSTTLDNLMREDGSISPYDLSVTHTGGSGNITSVAPGNLPDHTPLLSGLDGLLYAGISTTFVWSDLTPGADYLLSLFEIKDFPEDLEQVVTIVGGANNPAPFTMSTTGLPTGTLIINDQSASSSRKLSKDAVQATASASGKITITVVSVGASFAELAGVAIQELSTITTPGFTITESSGSTSVGEIGSTDTFDVVLNAQPTTHVVLTVNASDTGEATVGEATLTFTPADWDTPQTVTVTGVDDLIVDGTQNSTVTISVDDANSDNAYDALADQTVSVTTLENNVAGFTVTETSGTTSVTESGSTDTFAVVLNKAPLTNVLFTLASDDTGEATIDKATLTFTPANWNVAQTVTVTGVDDSTVDGDQNSTVTISVDDANSDNAFDVLDNQTVSVITTDDDVAGFTVTESAGTTSVSETGTSDTFTVVLDKRPLTNVVLTVIASDPGEATIDQSTLTFTPANWDTVQTVLVAGVDDAISDGTQNSLITLSVNDALSDNAFDAVSDRTVDVVTLDDEATALVGVDFDPSGNSPLNWNTITTGSSITINNLIREDGSSSPYDLLVTLVGESDFSTSVSPANLPDHTPSLSGLDGLLYAETSITLAWSDLTPGSDYLISLFDIEYFSDVIVQTVTIVGEANNPAPFTMSTLGLNVGDLIINEQLASPSKELTEDAVQATADANGNITITIQGVDGSFTELAGVAIQELLVTTSPGFTITESAGATSVEENGTTDTFDVVLDKQPTTNVVLTVTPADATEASVDKSTLTFTPANWNVPQSVTVTGVDDLDADGDESSLITISVDDANSDDTFDNLANQTVTVTTTDDDTAGFTLSKSTTSVAESGTTDSFTVVLDKQPLTDVVFTLSSSDTGEATIDKSTLTFTTANWNQDQTVTVTGIDDVLVDGSQISTITISVNDATSDNAFDDLVDQTVSVTTTDNDTSSFTITESASTTSVDESGTTDSFTVVLDKQPLTDVVFSLGSSDTGEATIDTSTLTFTSANWDQAQTVTVTGIDDMTVDGSQNSKITISVDDTNSDNAFDALPDQTISVTTTDDDVGTFTITESASTTSVDESGTTDSFTVVLNKAPLTDVVFSLESSDTGEATIDNSTLTFTSANWNVAQLVTVTGVQDVLVDGSQNSTITISVDDANSDTAFDTLVDQTVSVTTTDDDVGTFTITETSGTNVSESGSTDTFTVVLDKAPLTDVVFTLGSSDTGEATIDKSTLTFTSANWNVAQLVTVTGIDDPTIDGNQNSTITISVNDATSDNAFDALADQTVSVTTTDNDLAAFTITETSGTSVSESGSTDTFTVVLDKQPFTDVVFTLNASDTGEATIDKSSLTFTPANWNQAQTITVTGIDDQIVDGSQNSTITISVDDAKSDNAFDALVDQRVSVTTTDNDAAAFTITETAGTTSVDESGTTDSFTVVLDKQPLTDVVFSLESSDTGEATIDTSTLTFTPANWDQVQTITVTGIDDPMVDGSQNSMITISVDDANSDNAFDTLANQTVTITTTDDDFAAFTLSKNTESVSESGTTDSFTVVLDKAPLADVVFTLDSSDSGEATTDKSTLTFTSANWNVAQLVTVTGIDDMTVDGSQISTITIAVDDANSDNAFDTLVDQSVSVTTTDNDVAGFTITESSGTTVSESGTTDSFTVVLDKAPLTDVVFTLNASDTGEATIDKSTLTFTTANWNQAQTITVTGVDDVLVDGSQNSTVTISIDDVDSDNAFDTLVDQTVTVTTTDDGDVHPPAIFDMALVQLPTSTMNDGSVASVPVSMIEVHEWEEFYLEVFMQLPPLTVHPLTQVQFTLDFDNALFQFDLANRELGGAVESLTLNSVTGQATFTATIQQGLNNYAADIPVLIARIPASTSIIANANGVYPDESNSSLPVMSEAQVILDQLVDPVVSSTAANIPT